MPIPFKFDSSKIFTTNLTQNWVRKSVQNTINS